MHVFSKNTLIFFGIYWLLGLFFGLLGTQVWLIYSEVMLYLLLLLWFIRIFRLKTEVFDKLRRFHPDFAGYLSFLGILPLLSALILMLSFTPWFPLLTEWVKELLQHHLSGFCWGITLLSLLVVRLIRHYRRSDDPLEIIEGDKENRPLEAKNFLFNLLVTGGLYWIVFMPLTAAALRFNSREFSLAADIWRWIFVLVLFYQIFIKTPEIFNKMHETLPLLSRYLASFGWLAYFWMLVPLVLLYEMSQHPHGISAEHWLLVVAPYAPLFNFLVMLLPLPLLYWYEKHRQSDKIKA